MPCACVLALVRTLRAAGTAFCASEGVVGGDAHAKRMERTTVACAPSGELARHARDVARACQPSALQQAQHFSVGRVVVAEVAPGQDRLRSGLAVGRHVSRTQAVQGDGRAYLAKDALESQLVEIDGPLVPLAWRDVGVAVVGVWRGRGR